VPLKADMNVRVSAAPAAAINGAVTPNVSFRAFLRKGTGYLGRGRIASLQPSLDMKHFGIPTSRRTQKKSA